MDSLVSKRHEGSGKRTGKLYPELIPVGECIEFTGSYQITIPKVTVNWTVLPKFQTGRNSESSLNIVKKGVSQKHCTIEKSNLGWVLTSHSKAGTKLMGSMLEIEKPSTLRCDDAIVIAGLQKFRFKCNANDCRKCNASMKRRFISLSGNISKSSACSVPSMCKMERDLRIGYSSDKNARPRIESSMHVSCEEQKKTGSSMKRRLEDRFDVQEDMELFLKGHREEWLRFINVRKTNSNNYEMKMIELDIRIENMDKKIRKKFKKEFKKEDNTRDIDSLKKEMTERKELAKLLKREAESLLADKKISENRVNRVRELECKKKSYNFNIVNEKLDELLDQEFTCSICSNLLVDATVTTCNHVFCSWCLEKWSMNKKVCPMCRSSLGKNMAFEEMGDIISRIAKMISKNKYNEYQELIKERTSNYR